jgi:hypothetical protein
MGRTSLITRPVEDYTSTLLHYQPQIYTKLLFRSRDPEFNPILRDFFGGGKYQTRAQQGHHRRQVGGESVKLHKKKARRKPGLVD